MAACILGLGEIEIHLCHGLDASEAAQTIRGECYPNFAIFSLTDIPVISERCILQAYVPDSRLKSRLRQARTVART